MTCNDVQLMMSAFVDGELDPANETEMFQHVGTCSDCQQFFRSLMSVRQSLATSTLHEPDDNFDGRIRASLSSAQRGRSVRTTDRLSLPVSVVASVATILIVASFLISPILFSIHQDSQGQSAEVVALDLPNDIQTRLARYLR